MWGDTVFADRAITSSAADPIQGDDGNNNLTGTSGDDVILTGLGNDTVHGGDGNDVIAGGRSSGGTPFSRGATVVDTDGNSGDAFITTGGDLLYGDGGNDTIYVGYGSTADGGTGIDQVYLSLEFAYQHWTAHTILYTFNELGLNVDLKQAATGSVTLSVGGIGNLAVTLTSIEAFNITFGRGDDRVFGGEQNDVLDGNFGNNELHGRGGDDRLLGGRNSDRLFGDDGNDVIFGGSSSSYYFEDFAIDELNGGAGDDLLAGGVGDSFDGGSGSDRATINLANATFSYSLDLAKITGAATYRFNDAASGSGQVGTSTANLEKIVALVLGSGNDRVVGDVSTFLDARSEIDFVYRGLYGGAGDDFFHLTGTLGPDFRSYVSGGAGNDTIVLDGDYSTLFRLGYNTVEDFETIVLAAGHDYNLGVSIGFDATLIDASALTAINSLTFTDYDALGALEIRGGAGADTVQVGVRWTGQQRIDLGAGNDTLVLDGNFATGFVFGANSIFGVETVRLLHNAFGENSYRLTLNDANTLPGTMLTVDGSQLGAGFRGIETLYLDGSAELNGQLAVIGGSGGDTLIGGHAQDWLQGESGSDTVSGGEGADSIWGGADDDLLDGGAGDDTISGGTGNDTVTYGSATSRVEVDLSWLEDQNTRGGGVDTLVSIENVIGSAFGDTLTGNSVANRLTGGAGGDILTGGAGADVFVYSAISDSTVAASDWITDFQVGDKIDLFAIDANSSTQADNAFSFIGTAAFGHVAGELRVTGSGMSWLVEGDTNGDGIADFAISVTANGLGAGDFRL